MKDFVVYTTITGGYDKIEQPLVTDDRFDYILFTDVASDNHIGVWEVRTIPYKNDDFKRVSLYPRMHPQ